MRKLGWGISLLSLMAMTAQASAAAACDPVSSAALKTAAVQQELMVAGFTCNASAAYNHFVIADRPALQKSDADLMAYFKARDGREAGYDTYKTKLANLAANQSAAPGSHFCSDTARAFRASEGVSLKDFVAGHHLLIKAPEACAVKYDRVEEAAVSGPSYALPAAPYGAPAAAQRLPDPRYEAMRRYADAGDTDRYADANAGYDRAAQRYDRQDQAQDYYVPPPPPPRPARREQDYYLQGYGYGPYAWLPARRRWYGSDY